MTYGLVRICEPQTQPPGEAVSHLAELVRGYCPARDWRPPHPAQSR